MSNSEFPPFPRLLITDFDGTLTKRDFYECALETVEPGLSANTWNRFVAGQLSHFDALRDIFAVLPDTENEVMQIARRTELNARLGASVQKLHARGWGVLVVSAGCDWYIQRLLAEHSVCLPVIANPGRLSPGHGLHLIAPTDSPFYDVQTGIDKAAIVKQAYGQYRAVAFAGNGRADLSAALCVTPELRFATGWLAEQLTAADEPYQRFEDWSEIGERLVMWPE
jgi:2-hydroxy-3-keto-5-methylthiopentenyl-1-phosphate phosphatase